MDYLKEYKRFLVAQMGMIELHKHCLEIEEQVIKQKQMIIEVVRKNPINKVTENDKAEDR